MILISDGYDEHSQAAFERRAGGGQECGDHDLRRRHRRRRGHLAQGRARAEAAGQRDRRPRVLSAPRRGAGRACTISSRPTRRTAISSRTRRATPRATAPGAPSSLTHSVGAVRGSDARRLSSAEAAADPADARVHASPTRPASTSRSAPTTWSCPEDGVEQKVDTFHEAATPVSIVLALDSSGSMRKTRRRPDGGGADVRRVAPAGGQARRCSSSRTACWWRTISAPTASPASTRSTATSPSAARRSTTRWPARFTTLKRVEGRRAVVVMTDGRDENNAGTAPGSRHNLAQKSSTSRARSTPRCCRSAWGPISIAQGLERLAEISGGLA